LKNSFFRFMLAVPSGLRFALIALGAIGGLPGNFAMAQTTPIVPDETLTPDERSLVVPFVPSIDIITGGAIRNSNLFHSFQTFNVEAGHGVYFFDPGNIQNIFSRVTGSSRSEIFGTLGTIQNSNGFLAPTNANLFLINPNGIIFGPGANLNLAGSFVATTASGIQFGNQGSFSAINPTTPDLLTVNPSAFLFNQIAPQPIVVRSTALDFSQPENLAFLRVNPNRSLLLVGGDVQLDAGLLSANRSRLELAGVAGSGTIGLVADNNSLSLNASPDTNRANVVLTNAATVSANGQGSTIAIQAHNLDVLDGSVISTGITSINALNDPVAQAGDIRINTTGTTTIAGSGAIRFGDGSVGQRISNVLSFVGEGSVGNSGNILIQTGSLKVQDSAQLGASIAGQGNAGDLSIRATDRVDIDGGLLNTGVFNAGEGKSGNLSIVGRSITLNNAFVSAGSTGAGEAGTILLQATDAVSLKDSNVPATFSGATGKGGSITVQAGSLFMDNSTLNTSTFGRGDAGNIAIRTSGSVGLSNTSFIGSSVVSIPELGFVGIGNGGTIQIDAATLSLSGKSTVSTTTFGIGNAGSIAIHVNDAIRVNNSTIFSDVAQGAIGNGGEARIQANSVELLNNSRLATGTLGQGNGGNLLVQANEFMRLSGNSLISSSVQAGGVGKAGDVTIQTRSLSLTDGSQIQSAISSAVNNLPAGQGQGGTVRINASDSVRLAGTNAEGFPSALTTTADTGSQGQAGDLYVTTPDLQIRDRAAITAETRNADPGGNIVLQAGNLTIANDGRVRTTASGLGNAGNININADAVQLQNGNIAADAARSGGGSITLNARDVRLRDRSLMNTNVAQGASGGGNITINANTVLALEDSDILANANQGRGGNITITANAFVADFFSNNRMNSVRYTGDITPFRGNGRVDISASSAIGISGNVTIPDFSFLQNNLTQLPQTLVDPSTLLANSCIVRSRQGGSFLITGAGGLAERPGDASVTDFPAGEVRATGRVNSHRINSQGGNGQGASNPPLGRGDRIVEPQSVYRLANGHLVLSRDCPR
jgi:filamentous hemagglutinin family protein